MFGLDPLFFAILASALKHSDYLITLDNEFLKSETLEMAKKKIPDNLKA